LQDLLNSNTITNESKVEGALKTADVIVDGSKDIGSSHTATVDLTKDLVDISLLLSECVL
jgi:hypothetical protein